MYRNMRVGHIESQGIHLASAQGNKQMSPLAWARQGQRPRRW